MQNQWVRIIWRVSRWDIKYEQHSGWAIDMLAEQADSKVRYKRSMRATLTSAPGTVSCGSISKLLQFSHQFYLAMAGRPFKFFNNYSNHKQMSQLGKVPQQVSSTYHANNNNSEANTEQNTVSSQKRYVTTHQSVKTRNRKFTGCTQ